MANQSKQAKRLREQARRNQLIRYQSGEPCGNGHVAERYVKTNTCVECLRQWRLNNPTKIANYAKEWQSANREHLREYHRKWRDKNKERWNELLEKSYQTRRAKKHAKQ